MAESDRGWQFITGTPSNNNSIKMGDPASRSRKYHEGWVCHKPSNGKDWKKYWVVIRGCTMFIFNNQKTTQRESHVGTLQIDSSTEVRTVNKDGKKKGFQFEMITHSSNAQKINKFKFDNANERDLWKAFILGIAQGDIPKDIHIMPGQLQDVFSAVNDFRNTPPAVPNLPRPATYWGKTDKYDMGATDSTGGSGRSSSPPEIEGMASVWSAGGGSSRSEDSEGSRNSGHLVSDGTEVRHRVSGVYEPGSIDLSLPNTPIPVPSDRGEEVFSLRQNLRKPTSNAGLYPAHTKDPKSPVSPTKSDTPDWGESRNSSRRGSVREDFHMNSPVKEDLPLFSRTGSTKNPLFGMSEEELASEDIWSQRQEMSAAAETTRLSRPQSLSPGSLEGTQNHLFHQHPDRNKEMPAWFFEDCSREEAESILTLGKKYGTVLMRESSSFNNSGSYVISYRQDVTGGTQINHYKVTKVPGGFRIDVDNPHDTMITLTDVMDFFVSVAGARGTRPMTTNDRAAITGTILSNKRGSTSSNDDRPPLLHQTSGINTHHIPTMSRHAHSTQAPAPPPPPPPPMASPAPPPPPPVMHHDTMSHHDSFNHSLGTPTSPIGGHAGQESSCRGKDSDDTGINGAVPHLPPRVRNTPPQSFADPSLNMPVPSKHVPSDTILRGNPSRDLDQQMGGLNINDSMDNYPTGTYQHSRADSIPPTPPPAPPIGGMIGSPPPPPPPSSHGLGVPPPPPVNTMPPMSPGGMQGMGQASIQHGAMSLRPPQPRPVQQSQPRGTSFEDELKRRVAVQREDIYATGKMEIRQNWT